MSGVAPVTFYIISIVIRSSNSAWVFGRHVQPNGDTDTEFEFQMRALGLTKETCLGSWELRKWCEDNRNRHYVSEWLLECGEFRSILITPESSQERRESVVKAAR